MQIGSVLVLYYGTLMKSMFQDTVFAEINAHTEIGAHPK